MARIDSILSIVVQQGATELRVGTDKEPKMFANGAQKRLAIPSMADDMLRHLLGEILAPEREEALRARGRLDVPYDAGPLGTFHVTLSAREGGIDATFVKGGGRAPARIEPPPASRREAAIAPPPAAPPPAAVAPSPVTGAGDGGTLAALLGQAVALQASDLHLVQGAPAVVRISGRLRPIGDGAPIDVDTLLAPVLDASARARLDAGVSADLGLALPGLGRFRLNVYRASQGLAVAARVLARTPPPLASLGLPAPLDELVDQPHGLVIVCGPTGSGKSTTLAALAEEALRRRDAVLVTLEDPIEYELTAAREGALVRQRQIGRDVRDFATGLRDALREDPDVILIGEMRDPETIGLALTAAETGHLVLASLHSRSTASAIERIVDAYPPERQGQIRVQLADSLRAVVAQRLLRRARGGGRVPAIEVLRATHGVASVIREGKTAQIATLLQSGRKEGMLPLERCLADLVHSAQITEADARAVANEPASLAAYLAK